MANWRSPKPHFRFQSSAPLPLCSTLMYNRYMSEIAKTPYDGYTVYRVRDKKQDRFLAVLVSPNHRTTIAYAKYVLETHLGRKLKPGHQAHHKNEDKWNDELSNLEEKEYKVHRIDHDADKTRKYILIDCPVCEIEFICEYRQSHWGSKRGSRTTCSMKCGRKPSKTQDEQVINKTLFLKKEERPDKRKRAVAQWLAATSS